MPADRSGADHRGPVPEEAWHAHDVARARGRVEMFNAGRPGASPQRLRRWTSQA